MQLNKNGPEEDLFFEQVLAPDGVPLMRIPRPLGEEIYSAPEETGTKKTPQLVLRGFG